MVLNKTVNFETMEEKKCPDEKNFDEIYGMTNIDLNSEIDDKTIIDVSQFQHRKILYIILALTLTTLACGVLLILYDTAMRYNHMKLDKNRDIERPLVKLELTQLFQRKNYEMINCRKYKTRAYCCDVFSEEEMKIIVEPCNVERILDLVDLVQSEDSRLRKNIQNPNSLGINEKFSSARYKRSDYKTLEKAYENFDHNIGGSQLPKFYSAKDIKFFINPNGFLEEFQETPQVFEQINQPQQYYEQLNHPQQHHARILPKLQENKGVLEKQHILPQYSGEILLLPNTIGSVDAKLNPIESNDTKFDFNNKNFELDTKNASGTINFEITPNNFESGGKVTEEIGENVNEETTSTKTEENASNNQQPRINQGTLEFNKNKDPFTASLDLQTNQHSSMSTCVNPFTFPAIPSYQINQQVSFPYDNNQLMKTPFLLNPPINPYQMQPFFPPFVPPGPFMPSPALPQLVPQPNSVQATGPNGQIFTCVPFSTPTNNNIAGIPGIEVRKFGRANNLQDLMENVKNESVFEEKSRQSISCPFGEKSCADGTKCIKKHRLCDSDVNCRDGSDEAFCSCTDRLAASKICDGFFDCPNGEDEIKCSGCSAKEFYCGDRSKFRKPTCISIWQRCDGIIDCPNGKDENECYLLADTLGVHQLNKISNAVGFLHRFYQGKWFPVCQGAEIGSLQVCTTETSNNNILPLKQMVRTDTIVDFINVNPQNEIWFTKDCLNDNLATFITCPSLQCGVRVMMKSHHRLRESEDSVEEILGKINNMGILEDNSTETVGATSRVVGGKKSLPAAWPWLVSIYKNGIFHCGGVIISEFWILSAAHCVDKFWLHYYEVQAGMLRRFSYSPMEQNRFVTHAIPYPFYDKSKLQHDISLMRLSEPVRFNRFVRPICLPSINTAGIHYKSEPTSGTVCTTVGWGATVEHGEDPDHMREVEIPIRDTCKYKEDIEGHEICAGLMEGGKDACQGDSGGPLMCRNPDNRQQWYLAGIVSHGEGCARPNEPGVYTRVSQYLDWISDNTRDDNLPDVTPLNKCTGFICKGTGRCLPRRRRCDKFVDCLLADDEIGCDLEETNNLFKQSIIDDILRAQDEDLDEILTKSIDLANTTDRNVNFVCKEMLQIVSASKRCDKKIDCEDATDELNCTCAEYLRHNNPSAICDGTTDCFDFSDEVNCSTCASDEYYCRKSKVCISLKNVCDGKAHCPMKEDEEDCFALSKHHNITLDNDQKPLLNHEGMLFKNTNNTWTPFCIDWKSNVSIAATICQYLGFSRYHKFKLIDLSNETKSSEIDINSSCTTLYVKCSNAPLNKIGKRLQNTPWIAWIYANGNFVCVGGILNENWILTTLNCSERLLKLKQNYITVLVGIKKNHLNVKSPYEQKMRVSESVRIENTEIVLLQLEKSLNFSRYVQPLNVFYKKEKHKERCFAVGADAKSVLKYVSLNPLEKCDENFKCFRTADVNSDGNCNNSNKTQNNWWSGFIFCEAGYGFYPASIFYERDGFCSFNKTKFLNLMAFTREMMVNAERVQFTVPPPNCGGFRCNLGQCIEKTQICNGIPNCRDGEDEDVILCKNHTKECNLENNCDCLPSELKCKNGKCVSKKVFCDKNNDCGDFSDQPDLCTCRSYLELTNPEKICDGEINCKDKTDEKDCYCGKNYFKCNRSNICVSNYMVCDGANDCPDGEDEEECFTFKSNTKRGRGEVMTRFAGKLYHGCFPDKMTTMELEDICRKLGYTSNTATKIPAPLHKADNITVLKPVLDDFYVTFLRRGRGEKFKLHMRTADEPYVKFSTDYKCNRLFLECL